MTILSENGKLASTDEVLLEVNECVSDEEYCNLIGHLNQFPAKEIRKELKKWALAHEYELVRCIGEWM